MLTVSLDPGNPLFIPFLFFCAFFLVLNLYYWLFFFRLARFRKEDRISSPEPVSVVICARNEYHHLKENLARILEQDHPDFEIVVVNNGSDDESAFLLERFAEHFSRLKVVEIKENLNFFSGKKFPLSIGIKSAKNKHILLTDADCHPAGNQWIRKMQEGFNGTNEVVLGYGAYSYKKGMTNLLIRYDTAQIAVQYLSFALAGIPYMGVGRNMAYSRDLFFRNKGFISHYKINSGDDDLFVNRVANRKNTTIVTNPESFTYSEPKTTFRQWFIQKKRHLQTGNHYRLKHKALLGAYTFSQVLFYLLLVILLSLNYNPLIVLSVLLLKLAGQVTVTGLCFTRLKEKDLIAYIPLLEIVLLLINGFTSIHNLIIKANRWK